MARIKKAQKGKTIKPTADSTAYFKNQEKSFRQLAKSEKGDSELSKFNKRFFENEAGKSVSSQLRQYRKGKPGYDKDGFPIKKQKSGGKTPAWTRSEGKDPKGGLNRKGVASYRAANPGSKLKMAVTTPPSKLKKGSKAANRRKSFCARMSGVKGPMAKGGKPTRKALALRKWNC